MNLFQVLRRPHFVVKGSTSERRPADTPAWRKARRKAKAPEPEDLWPFYSHTDFRFTTSGLARLGAAWLAEAFQVHLRSRPDVRDVVVDVYNDGRAIHVRYDVGGTARLPGYHHTACFGWHETDDEIWVIGEERVPVTRGRLRVEEGDP